MDFEHQLSDRTRVRIEVEHTPNLSDDPAVTYAVLGYPLAAQLWRRTGAYPVQAIEAWVSGLVGHPMRWECCTDRGGSDGWAYEVWRFVRSPVEREGWVGRAWAFARRPFERKRPRR